jgi:hypothetical protein
MRKRILTVFSLCAALAGLQKAMADQSPPVFTLAGAETTIESLGVGTESLLGGDLTDPENDGDEAAGPGDPSWNWASIDSSHEPGFQGGNLPSTFSTTRSALATPSGAVMTPSKARRSGSPSNSRPKSV